MTTMGMPVPPGLPQPGVFKSIRGGGKTPAVAPVEGTGTSNNAPPIVAAAPFAQPPPLQTNTLNSLNDLQLALLRAVRKEDELAVHRAAGTTPANGTGTGTAVEGRGDSATGTTLVDSAVSGPGSASASPSLAYLVRNTDWTAPATRAALTDANHVGNLLLLWAAMRGHDELASAILTAGISPNTVVPWTPGGPSNPTEAARLADLVEEAESHQLPLILAAQHNHMTTMKLLLAAGANVDASADLGWTALLRAAFYGYPDAVSLLLASRASPHAVNSDGMTALHGAIHGSHLACARLLLGAGASYSVKDNFGSTPTLLARAEDSLPLYSLLWSSALSRNDRSILTEVDPNTQRTPLHDLARLKAPVEMFEPLLPTNPTSTPTPSPVTAPDSTGTSPLIYAALSGSGDLVTLLIRRGLPLFPHPTIDRALPTVVSLLTQLSRPSPLPDPAAKLKELSKVDSAASASEARFPNPGAMKRAADLRAGATDALVSLLSACSIVKESRSVVLSELEGVLRGMEAEVLRVRGARSGLKAAANFDPAKEARVKELWAQLQSKVGPISGVLGDQIVSSTLQKTKGEIDELIRKRVGESGRQEKRARVQEDGVRKLGHAVKHSIKWARADLERWDSAMRDVERALDASILRQRELLGRCILLADAAGRDCMERMSLLADAGEEATAELTALRTRLEEVSKLGVWCKGKLRKLERIAATRTGLEPPQPLPTQPQPVMPAPQQQQVPSSLDRPGAGRTVPMVAGRAPLQPNGPVWISSKGKAPAGGVGVLPPMGPGMAQAPTPAAIATKPPLAGPMAMSQAGGPAPAPASAPAPAPAAPITNGVIDISLPTTSEPAGPWNMMKNMVSAVAGFGYRGTPGTSPVNSPALATSALPPSSVDGRSPPGAPVPAAPPKPAPSVAPVAAAAVVAAASTSLTSETIGSPDPPKGPLNASGKAALPSKVRKGPPPPEKNADTVPPALAPSYTFDSKVSLPTPPAGAPPPAAALLGSSLESQQSQAAQQAAIAATKPMPPPPVAGTGAGSMSSSGSPAPGSRPTPPPLNTASIPEPKPNGTSQASVSSNSQMDDLDAAAALDRKVAALQARMDSPAASPSASPTSGASPSIKRSNTGGANKRKNNLASILDKYGM